MSGRSIRVFGSLVMCAHFQRGLVLDMRVDNEWYAYLADLVRYLGIDGVGGHLNGDGQRVRDNPGTVIDCSSSVVSCTERIQKGACAPDLRDLGSSSVLRQPWKEDVPFRNRRSRKLGLGRVRQSVLGSVGPMV